MKKGIFPPPASDTSISAYGRQRRNMLKFFGASAAVITIGASCNDDDDNNNGGVNLGSGDIGVLNYAYALEQLEAAFYTRVTQSQVTGFTATDTLYFNDVMRHEVNHRDLFKAALGSNAIGNLDVDFSSIDFTNRTSVLTAARTFEDTGVAAYNGAGKLLVSTDYLLLAGKIVSVEARHAAAIRDLISNGTFSDTTDANGLDPAKSPSEILAAIAPFVKTSINASGLPTS